MDAKAFIEKRTPFLSWLVDWQATLEPVPFGAAIPHPERTAILCVDLIVGFAHEGPLSSPRVAGIVPPIVKLFVSAEAAGVQHFVLTQDCHTDDTPEFGSFAPHCVCGSNEAETVPQLLALPFSDRFTVIPKNSISSAIGTTLDAWLNQHHQDVNTLVVVGDCTDLCTFQLAMHLRLRANAHGYKQRVIVPADCVQTYDLPIDIAENLGIMPHDGDLMHAVFLYQMALNGIEVVASLT
jgi:nicotinamidase-related amidase